MGFATRPEDFSKLSPLQHKAWVLQKLLHRSLPPPIVCTAVVHPVEDFRSSFAALLTLLRRACFYLLNFNFNWMFCRGFSRTRSTGISRSFFILEVYSAEAAWFWGQQSVSRVLSLLKHLMTDFDTFARRSCTCGFDLLVASVGSVWSWILENCVGFWLWSSGTTTFPSYFKYSSEDALPMCAYHPRRVVSVSSAPFEFQKPAFHLHQTYIRRGLGNLDGFLDWELFEHERTETEHEAREFVSLSSAHFKCKELSERWQQVETYGEQLGWGGRSDQAIRPCVVRLYCPVHCSVEDISLIIFINFRKKMA